MTTRKLRLPPLAKSLSARLLWLTIFFVMLAEVLIYAPSAGRFRLSYLQERLASAHLAILALDATPDRMIGEELERELLLHVGAHSVALTRPGAGKLLLMSSHPEVIDASYDLRNAGFLGLIRDALVTLMHDDGRVLRIVGSSPQAPRVIVEVVLDEAPMRRALIDYSQRILALSLFISVITASLVYLSLHLLTVRPMRRITASMAHFRENPEDASQIVRPSGRSDEVGLAERELAGMQDGLRRALQQRAHLAALGTAVTKIHHDLRNILATARLVSDRLSGSEDPEVRRVTPTLLRTIDRAVQLCGETLKFASEGAPRIEATRFDLKDLVDEVGHGLPPGNDGVPIWHNLVGPDSEIRADRDQLHRVLGNLGHNAVQAGATRVDVSVRRADGQYVVEVADNGPGLAPRAREHLFKPFAASTRPGSSGLGLAIARELVRAHGGDLVLDRSTAAGTCFRIVLPASPEAV